MKTHNDNLQSLNKELKLNGFDTKIKGNSILMDTIAGEYIYSLAFDNYMQDYYRFIRLYGGMLQKYGLKINLKYKYMPTKTKEHESYNGCLAIAMLISIVFWVLIIFGTIGYLIYKF